MSFQRELPVIQNLIPFVEINCSKCPIKKEGLCEGTFDFKTYSMKGEHLAGCLDLERLEKYFFEVFDIYEPIPKSYNQENLNLPSTILGIKDGRIDLTRFDTIPLFAVPYSEFAKNNGDLKYRNMQHLKEVLELPINSRVALIGTSMEKKQQAVWKISNSHDIWKRISEFGFEFATSMTFPVWDINPRSDQIINQLRNYLSSDILANLGVPMIPFIYPFDECDYRNFGKWIEKRPSIKKLAILARYYKTDFQFAQLINNMKKIQSYAKREIEFLIVGVTKPSKIQMALQNFNNSRLLSSRPYCEAMVKGKLFDENFHSTQRLDIPKSDLVFMNFQVWTHITEDFRTQNMSLKT
jgi:hypothetical protein